MKPATVLLGEMTNPEVDVFLEHSQTVLVPIGSTEQHGPHGPLLTDVLVAQAVSERAALTLDAAVAPSVNYGLSYPHVGFRGVVHVRVQTFMALVEDLCVSLADIGFRRIVFVNGHYDNTYAIAYACASAAGRMAAGARAFPINYWDGMTADERAEFFDQGAGLHANLAETSAVLALNPDLVDMDRANAEFPPFPASENAGAVHTAFFFSAPGSIHRASRSGTWGDARLATREIGERFLDIGVASTIRVLADIERTFEAMPER
jgi:creatinine amidohydrolase